MADVPATRPIKPVATTPHSNAICTAVYTTHEGEERTVDVVGWNHGANTYSNNLIAVVKDGGMFYEVGAHLLRFVSW